MKKNVLALSIATMVGGLGFAGAANAALSVNESGAGHILMVPYYTAQNGNMTVLHVTNTDLENGKAVKVRFRGASNSDDVLDFQVFMSPGDVWTAAVSKDAETGKAKLVTADNTCTYPPIPAEGIEFVTNRLNQASWNTDALKAEQTLEGYVEILTMADIPTASTRAATDDPRLYHAIKHVNGVAPCSTAVLEETLDVKPTTQSNATLQLASNTSNDFDLVPPNPIPSLNGQWYVMNVEQTTVYSAAMPAISSDATPYNVFSPQDVGAAVLETADPLMLVGAIAPQYYDVPDLSTPYDADGTTPELQAENLTNAIVRNAVINQYASDAEIDAKTDWVFSMPTRRYSIAANYDTTTEAQNRGLTQVSTAGAVLNYRVVNDGVAGNIFTDRTDPADPATAGDFTSLNNKGQICITAGATQFWDREESAPTTPGRNPVFSPGTPTTPNKFELCGEVSVLAFSADESALGAKLSRQNVDAKFVNGWGKISFSTGTGVNAVAQNVPVLGSAFIKLSNPSAREGVSGTYGLTWAHSYVNP